jgi:hypothetical protein
VAREEQGASVQKKSGASLSSLAPAIIFVLILGAALVFYILHNIQTAKAAEALKEQLSQLGLPDDYPLQDIPVYPGLKIATAKKLDAMSADNKPMDEWELHATSLDDKKKIFDFVKDKMMARGMSQTQYISIPTGYGLTYGDEQYSVEYEIEKQKKDKETRVVMRVYRIR